MSRNSRFLVPGLPPSEKPPPASPPGLSWKFPTKARLPSLAPMIRRRYRGFGAGATRTRRLGDPFGLAGDDWAAGCRPPGRGLERFADRRLMCRPAGTGPGVAGAPSPSRVPADSGDCRSLCRRSRRDGWGGSWVVTLDGARAGADGRGSMSEGCPLAGGVIMDAGFLVRSAAPPRVARDPAHSAAQPRDGRPWANIQAISWLFRGARHRASERNSERLKPVLRKAERGGEGTGVPPGASLTPRTSRVRPLPRPLLC
jgi:hypothetical protein